MSKLRDILFAAPSKERDQYFLDLYDQAYKQAEAAAKHSQEKSGTEVIFGADEIAQELDKLLLDDLSYTDFSRKKVEAMFNAAEKLGDTLARPQLANNVSDVERTAWGMNESKVAAIQDVLMNRLLGEGGYAAPLKALEHYQLAQLSSICEKYQLDLASQVRSPVLDDSVSMSAPPYP